MDNGILSVRVNLSSNKNVGISKPPPPTPPIVVIMDIKKTAIEV